MNDDGNGNANYLDRHDVKCGANEAIRSFRLVRSGNGKRYQYVYDCCKTQLSCQPRKVANAFTDDGRGKMVYLDRQTVQCGNNFINQFRLNRDRGGTKYRYIYQCCDVKARKTCKNLNTPFNDDGGEKKNTVYLDRHNVRCPNLYSLTKHRLVRSADRSKVRIDFTCCRILGRGM